MSLSLGRVFFFQGFLNIKNMQMSSVGKKVSINPEQTRHRKSIENILIAKRKLLHTLEAGFTCLTNFL